MTSGQPAGAAPRVSVVIPAHDALAYLGEAIASVLAQSYDDFEVVVVDDGGHDDLPAFVDGLGEPRVRCLRQEHAGQATARNLGIARSRGELVGLLDADDRWHPTKLALQVAALDERPEVGLVHCGVRYVDQDGAPLGRELGASGDGAVWDQIVLPGSDASVRCGSTPLIRRSCFEAVGTFDTDLTYSEDWDMWLRIASRFAFLALDATLVDYRQHPHNLSKRHERIVANQTAILDKAFAAHPDAAPALRRRASSQGLVFAAWQALFAGDRRAARRHLASATRCDPAVVLRPNTVALGLRLVGLEPGRARGGGARASQAR